MPDVVTSYAHVLDDALVLGAGDAAVVIDTTGIEPWTDVAQAGRSLDGSVVVSVFAVTRLGQGNLHDRAHAPVRFITVSAPHGAVKVHRRP